GAGAWLVQRNLLALQIGHRCNTRVLAGHDVNALRIEIGNEAQIVDSVLAFPDPGAGLRPVGNIRLRETRLEIATSNAVDIADRAVRCNGGGDQSRHAARATIFTGARARWIGD